MLSAKETILYILDRLKYEWELLPIEEIFFKDCDAISHKKIRQGGIKSTLFFKWCAEASIRDNDQLKSILRILQNEGVIEKFEFRKNDIIDLDDVFEYDDSYDYILWIIYPEDFENKFNNVHKNLTKNEGGTATVRPKQSINERDLLKFYSETCDISYKNELGNITKGGKGFAFLSLLGQDKNTPFNIKDIKEYCNPLVNNTTHLFKTEKDIDDTLRLIKSKLKIGNRAFFPIEKKGAKNDKKWIWTEK
jgi:hypothetical protein